MKRLFMISMMLVAFMAQASDEVGTRLYGMRPSGNAGASSNMGGNSYALANATNVSDTMMPSATGGSVTPTYVINLTPELAEISIQHDGSIVFLSQRVNSTEVATFGTKSSDRLLSVSATIPSTGQKLTRRADFMGGGFFALRRNPTDGQYYIDEFTGRVARYTAYLINVTGFPVSSYTIFHSNPFCSNTNSINPIPNLNADVRALGSCAVSYVQGRVSTPMGTFVTNKLESGPNEGVYIFRNSGYALFEAAGPFRFRTVGI